ncbi:MAG: hypothetical protein PHQ60_04035 [Sideroxydans sp.]|nr:hypothetical protein [Sideroxydans sp.]
MAGSGVELLIDMAKYKQTKEEFLQHLAENLGFLKASSSSFDAGFHGEAKRLALAIRVLVHDIEKSKALLSLLGFKTKMGFFDTAFDVNPKNLMPQHGLVGLQLSAADGSYYAPLERHRPGSPNKFVFFPEWWNKVVIVDSKKNRFSRRELVLALANKDGGGHVDLALDENYANLSRKNSVGWIYSNETTQKPMEGVELFSVRQIAFELLKSIERQLSKAS